MQLEDGFRRIRFLLAGVSEKMSGTIFVGNDRLACEGPADTYLWIIPKQSALMIWGVKIRYLIKDIRCF